MRSFTAPVIALAGTLVAMGAFAQGAQPQGSQPQGGMMHMMPMQQGQQQGGMMMGCPMMQRMAAMDTRLRQLEERAGIPAPPAQPGPAR
jgi:hypothetical protein